MHLRHKYCPFTAIVIFSTVLPNLADCFDHNLYQHGRSQSARGQWCVLNVKKNVLCGAMNCDETKASCGGNRCCSPRIYRYEGGREVMWRLVGGKLVNAGEISPRPTVRARKMCCVGRWIAPKWRLLVEEIDCTVDGHTVERGIAKLYGDWWVGRLAMVVVLSAADLC